MNEQERRRLLGLYLKQKRDRLGLSQEGAARRVGLTRQQWNRLENGSSGTKRETIIQIAEGLGLNVAEALIKFAPEHEASLPSELRVIGFDGLDRDDLNDIAEFIRFKKDQKEKEQ